MTDLYESVAIIAGKYILSVVMVDLLMCVGVENR